MEKDGTGMSEKKSAMGPVTLAAMLIWLVGFYVGVVVLGTMGWFIWAVVGLIGWSIWYERQSLREERAQRQPRTLTARPPR